MLFISLGMNNYVRDYRIQHWICNNLSNNDIYNWRDDVDGISLSDVPIKHPLYRCKVSSLGRMV
jgi:hypothetical protein